MWSYQYVGPMLRACRKAFAHLHDPRARIRMSWAAEPLDLCGFRREFVQALNRRINLKAGPPPAWRKLQPDWQASIHRDRDRLADMAKRYRVYQFETAECRSRFGDRLARRDDDEY